jgi:hypothetical protein
MNDHTNDLERARELGMSVEEFQAMVGIDPLETYSEFIKGGVVGPKDTRKTDDTDDVELKEDQKKKKRKGIEESLGEIETYEWIERELSETDAASHLSLHDEFTDVTGIGDGTMVPFETDEDVKNKDAKELERYWDRPPTTPADQALYYGFHIHSKDNVYGLHAHYPGAPLGGGHLHGAQNPLGYHTHRYNQEELLQFKFARPGIMIQLDGPHVHQQNAPDGKHAHQEENFGPASDRRAEKVAERDRQADTN